MKKKAWKALYGVLAPVSSNDEATKVLGYILDVMHAEDTADEVMKRAFQYNTKEDEPTVRHIVCNTVLGDNQVSLVIETKNYPVPEELDTEDGVFAFVYNKDRPYESALKYIYFDKRDDGYHRIG